MKHHIMHAFGISTPCEKKSTDHFKDLHKLKLQANFGVNLTLSLGGVINYMLNVKFITPGDEVRLTSKFARSFGL